MDSYKWVHSSAYSSVPPDAVVGGNDTDGAIIYVGRAFHNGDTLVAKVVPSKHIAFVSWRGEEIPKEHFEILCGQNLAWVHCYDHAPPENAVLCGETSLGQPVYIGRGHYNGSLTVGKISSVHRALFIPYGGTEKRLESYEILVHNRGPTPGWALPIPLEEKKPLIELEGDFKPFPPPPPPPPPAYASVSPTAPFDPPPPYAPFTYTPQPEIKPTFASKYESRPEKKPYAFAVCYKPPVEQPAYVTPAYTLPPTQTITPAETYIPPPTQTITPAETYVPPPTQTITPAETYVPPPTPSVPSAFAMWVHANGNYTPPNAFRAGQDSDFSPLFICRAYHNGHLLPGKANPNHRSAYVCCDGQEIRKQTFEVLVGEKYHWVSTYNGIIPPRAVEGGRAANGEVLYIGRVHHNGSLTPGKVHPSHGCLYIPYGGQEIRHTNYEVLVHW